MVSEKPAQAGPAQDEVLAGERVTKAVGSCGFVCVEKRKAGLES